MQQHDAVFECDTRDGAVVGGADRDAAAAAVEVEPACRNGASRGISRPKDRLAREVPEILVELGLVLGALEDFLEDLGRDADIGVRLQQRLQPAHGGRVLPPEEVDPYRGVDQVQDSVVPGAGTLVVVTGVYAVGAVEVHQVEALGARHHLT